MGRGTDETDSFSALLGRRRGRRESEDERATRECAQRLIRILAGKVQEATVLRADLTALVPVSVASLAPPSEPRHPEGWGGWVVPGHEALGQRLRQVIQVERHAGGQRLSEAIDVLAKGTSGNGAFRARTEADTRLADMRRRLAVLTEAEGALLTEATLLRMDDSLADRHLARRTMRASGIARDLLDGTRSIRPRHIARTHKRDFHAQDIRGGSFTITGHGELLYLWETEEWVAVVAKDTGGSKGVRRRVVSCGPWMPEALAALRRHMESHSSPIKKSDEDAGGHPALLDEEHVLGLIMRHVLPVS
jgi:hypothetical protein